MFNELLSYGCREICKEVFILKYYGEEIYSFDIILISVSLLDPPLLLQPYDSGAARPL